MKRKLLINSIFLTLGIMLLVVAFKGHGNAVLLKVKEANLFWVAVVLATALFAHIVRALRWRELLTPLGNTKIIDVFSTLMLGYVINLAVPRLGEVSKSGLLSKKSDMPFASVLGTVIIERTVDVIMLLLAVLMTLFFHYTELSDFFNTFIIVPISGLLYRNIIGLVIGSGLFLGLLAVLVYKFKALKNLFKRRFLNNLMLGLSSILKMKRPIRYIGYTFTIWIAYYFMCYFTFKTLPDTEHLSLWLALVVFSIGGIGRIIPVQGGGMGAYHFVIMKLLAIYGIGSLISLSLATMLHGIQIIFYLLVGGVCFLVYVMTPYSSTSSKSM